MGWRTPDGKGRLLFSAAFLVSLADLAFFIGL
jgi:hypothetical protein